MDASSRRSGYRTPSEVEARLWARGLRRRWFVVTAGLLSARLAPTIARAKSRILFHLPPRYVAMRALVDAAMRPRSAGG